jgi:hypothetical protein
MQFSCLLMEFMPSQRTNKLCTHVHHRDCSTAAAIFAKGTYFMDMPHKMQTRTQTYNRQTKCSSKAGYKAQKRSFCTMESPFNVYQHNVSLPFKINFCTSGLITYAKFPPVTASPPPFLGQIHCPNTSIKWMFKCKCIRHLQWRKMSWKAAS